MGQAFVRILNAAGAILVVADLEDGLRAGAQAFKASSTASPAMQIAANVSHQSDVDRIFAEINRNYGRLDFLVNNVLAKPKGYYADTESYSRETWDETIAGNLTSAFLCTREAARLMVEKHTRGSIVMTSSIYGISGPDQRIYEKCSPRDNPYDPGASLNAPASYSASKAGLIGLSKYFATLLGPARIRVNTLIPGGVFDNQEDAFHAEYVKRVPLGRMGVFTDYSGAILFLVSDASRYMTGSSLIVDGGWTAW